MHVFVQRQGPDGVPTGPPIEISPSSLETLMSPGPEPEQFNPQQMLEALGFRPLPRHLLHAAHDQDEDTAQQLQESTGGDGQDAVPTFELFSSLLQSIFESLRPNNATASRALAELPHVTLAADGDEMAAADENEAAAASAAQESLIATAAEEAAGPAVSRKSLSQLRVVDLAERLENHGVDSQGFPDKAALVDALLSAEAAAAEARSSRAADLAKAESVKVLRARPRRRFLSSCFDHDSSSTCTVCMADFKVGDVVTQLPGCGHWFHLGSEEEHDSAEDEECCPGLLRWLGKNHTCPNCKATLPKECDEDGSDNDDETSAAMPVERQAPLPPPLPSLLPPPSEPSLSSRTRSSAVTRSSSSSSTRSSASSSSSSSSSSTIVSSGSVRRSTRSRVAQSPTPLRSKRRRH